MIKTLTIKGLKGVSAQYDLGKMNIFHGRNSAGKSAVLDAVTIGLLGYHPKLGKKPSSTMELASGSIMTVALDADVSTWRINSKGAAQAPQVDSGVPPAMIDLRDFFSRTAQGRTQYLMECAGGGDVSVKSIIKKIEPDTPEEFRDELKRIGVHHEGDAVGFFVECIAELKKACSEAAAKVKAEEEVVSTSALDDATQAHQPDVSAKLRDAKAKLAEFDRAMNEVKGEYTARLNQLNEAKRMLEQTVVDDSKREAAEKWAGRGPDVEAIAQQITELETSATIANTTRGELLKGIQKMSVTINQKQATLKAVMESGSARCPTCGHDSESWIEDAVQMHQADIDTLDAQKDVLQEQVTQLSNDYNTLQAQISELAAKKEKWQGSVDRAKLYLKNYEASVQTRSHYEAEVKRIGEVKEPSFRMDERAQLDNAVQELEIKQRKHVAQLGVKAQNDRVTKRLLDHKEAHEGYKNALAKAVEIQSEFVTKSVKGIVGMANSLIEPVLGRSLSYSNGVFSLGSVNMSTLSGSEEIVVYCGIQMALCQSSPRKILLVDEMGRCDKERKESMLSTLNGLIEKGSIHQFIGVDVAVDYSVPEGTNVVEVKSVSNDTK